MGKSLEGESRVASFREEETCVESREKHRFEQDIGASEGRH